MLANNRYFPPPKTDASCQWCQDLDLSRPGIDGILGIPLGHLQTSAVSGCSCCKLLIKTLGLPGLDPPEKQELIGMTLFSGVEPKGSKPLPMTARLQTEFTHFAEIELYTETDPIHCITSIGSARNIEADASSKRCVDLMKSWMDDCSSNHGNCRHPETSLLPDRVLDVRSDQDPHLILNQNGEMGTYAALSHCWGGQVSLKLQEKDLSNWCRGIPIQAFPKTFQHAIEVCRALQIQFLWIDSLCIIQDSAQDWAIQGSKMDAVYSNCHVAIAADGAHDSNHGFLRDPRRKFPVLTLNLPRWATKGGTSELCEDKARGEDVKICARKKGVGNMDIFMHHSWSADSRSKLSTRGWILQESVLAPRVLHFTAEEISWECRSLSQCECQTTPHTFAYETPMKLRLPTKLDHKEHWGRLVQEFTCRDLTYPSDRLPAMSGIASHMHSKSSSVKFYAGLWSDSFAQSLLWFCLDRGMDLHSKKKGSNRIRLLSAPTWSWASVTGRVIFPASQNTSCALENLQVACSPSGPNMYGTVSSATVTATAYIFRGKLIEHQERKGVFEVQLTPTKGGDHSPLRTEGEVFPDVIGTLMEIQAGEETILLDPVGDSGNSYLLLRPVSHVSSTYERVGIYMTRSPLCELQDIGLLMERQRITII